MTLLHFKHKYTLPPDKLCDKNWTGKLHIRVKCARLLSVMLNIYLRQNIPLRVVHKKNVIATLSTACASDMAHCTPLARISWAWMCCFGSVLQSAECHRSCFALIIVINQWMTFVHLTLALSWLPVRFCTYRRSLFNNISNCSSCFYRNFICEMPWIEN